MLFLWFHKILSFWLGKPVFFWYQNIFGWSLSLSISHFDPGYSLRFLQVPPRNPSVASQGQSQGALSRAFLDPESNRDVFLYRSQGKKPNAITAPISLMRICQVWQVMKQVSDQSLKFTPLVINPTVTSLASWTIEFFGLGHGTPWKSRSPRSVLENMRNIAFASERTEKRQWLPLRVFIVIYLSNPKQSRRHGLQLSHFCQLCLLSSPVGRQRPRRRFLRVSPCCCAGWAAIGEARTGKATLPKWG